MLTTEQEILADLRTHGWAVAVHNDYRQDGEPRTFWLLTQGDRCVKGEGRTDLEALKAIVCELEGRYAAEPLDEPDIIRRLQEAEVTTRWLTWLHDEKMEAREERWRAAHDGLTSVESMLLWALTQPDVRAILTVERAPRTLDELCEEDGPLGSGARKLKAAIIWGSSPTRSGVTIHSYEARALADHLSRRSEARTLDELCEEDGPLGSGAKAIRRGLAVAMGAWLTPDEVRALADHLSHDTKWDPSNTVDYWLGYIMENAEHPQRVRSAVRGLRATRRVEGKITGMQRRGDKGTITLEVTWATGLYERLWPLQEAPPITLLIPAGEGQ